MRITSIALVVFSICLNLGLSKRKKVSRQSFRLLGSNSTSINSTISNATKNISDKVNKVNKKPMPVANASQKSKHSVNNTIKQQTKTVVNKTKKETNAPLPKPVINKTKAITKIKQKTDTIKWEDDRSYFLTSLTIGKPPQNLIVSVDTGADFSWFPSINCKECNDDEAKFVPKRSISYKATDKTIVVKDKNGDANGVISSDDVSLGNYETKGFSFALINSLEKGYFDYKNGKLSLSYKPSQGKGFLDALKENKKISRKIITLVYNDKGASFGIGGYSKETAQKIKNTTFYTFPISKKAPSPYDNLWTCELSNGVFGKDVEDSFEIDGYAYFDSGSNFITAPFKYQARFKEKYTSKCIEVKIDNGDILYVCDEDSIELNDVDPLYLVLNGIAFKVPPKSLFKRNLDDKNFSFGVRFSEEKGNVWSLGQNFMNQFTVILNQDEGNVGLVGGETFNYKELKKKEEDEEKNKTPKQTAASIEEEKEKRLTLIISVAGGVLVVVALVLVILGMIRSLRRPAEDEHPLIK